MEKDHSEQFIKLVEDAQTRVNEISPSNIRDMLSNNDDFTLIDVRERHEFEESRIPGSKHISKGVIERDIEDEIPDKDTELVLYCGGGYRSALAADNLQKMGYKNVNSLAGGFRGWKQSNLPIED